MRWLVLLTEFDIHYVTQKSIRGSIVADHLASLPVSDARAIDDFPDEDVAAVTSLSGWRMYFDGAANHSGYGIGVCLYLGIRDSPELGIRQMEVFGDSNLVLRQIQGEWKTRDVKLKPYHAYLELLVGRFDDLRYTHLPRAQNQFADALATLASMIDIPVDATVRPLLIESRSAPAYCCLIDDVEPDDGLPWYHDIYHFLRLGVYPEAATAKDKRALRQLATRFVICGETLYRRSPDGMLLLCLDRASADRVMREVHAGVCGPHMGGHMLARKIMRTGYFWLTMETDCCQFVQRCPECQIHGDLIHVPPSELHALTSPWPFSVWGIDIIGKISPKSSSGHEFILVAIDYFTKSHIICRYGVPHELISDRGVHFRAEVDTLVQRYSIRHHRSSAYRPQTNGAVEAANKNIKRILRRMVETSRDWSEKLPFALWAYRTSFRTSTGATPYSLVYGMEAMLPVEIEMGSLRVALEQQIPEADWAQARFDQLNLLDERRLRAADHVRAYQRKMARAFKKRGVDPRGRCMVDGFRWKPILRANQCGSAKERPISGSILRIIITHITISSFCFICLLIDIIFTLGISDHPEAMGSDVVFSSLYLDRSDSVVFGLPGSFMDPHGLARSSLTGCSSRRGHDRYLTEPLRSTARSALLDTWMPSCLSIWEVTCAMMDDFMTFVLRTCRHLMPYWGIFRFGDLYGSSQRSPLVYMIIHGYEIHARSMFDFILSGYSEEPLLSHSARFIPFDIVVIPGWSCLWCLDFPRHHFRGYISDLLRVPLVLFSVIRTDRVHLMSYWGILPSFSLEAIVLSLSFETRRVPFSHFQRIEICSGMPHWASRAITVVLLRLPEPLLSSCLGFQSHSYHLVLASRAITVISFRLPEPSLIILASRASLSSLLRLPKPLLSSCLGFQSHHCHSFRLPEPSLSSWLASRAITVILFRFSRAITVVLLRLPEPFLSSRFGFQSHHYHLVQASRVITVSRSGFQSHHIISFRLPEPSLSSRLGFQRHHCHLASRAITVILFKLLGLLPSSSVFKSFYFLGLVLRVSLVILSHNSWLSYHWLCASCFQGFTFSLGFSSQPLSCTCCYSSHSLHRVVPFGRILARTRGWFDRYASLTLISWTPPPKDEFSGGYYDFLRFSLTALEWAAPGRRWDGWQEARGGLLRKTEKRQEEEKKRKEGICRGGLGWRQRQKS
ncbi:Transposon Tf2-2 polyprotein [Vitis vinifera]|uniref:Transposon Tf2-2 polyprotein n=1 Tax=Vitis vinifera TaxID=29760 RepID=A0A438EL35_VITVI|nr:Transposon Tf2-2 polyprotein [Vitis vinifera]